MKRFAVVIVAVFAILAGGLSPSFGGQKKKQQKKDQKSQKQEPRSAGQMVPLKGLSRLQTDEAYSTVVQWLFFEQNYEMLQREETGRTKTLDKYQWLQKPVSGDRTKILLVGYSLKASGPDQLTVWEQVKGGKTKPTLQADVKKIVSKAQQAAKQAAQMKKKFSPRNLKISTYQLSYITPKRATQMLSTLGFNTSKPKGPVSLAQLPLIWQTPGAKPPTVPQKGDNPNMGEETTSGQMNQFIILYHPMVADEVNQLKKLLEEKIDVPSRQVLIESMIVELTEEARRELGVEWEWAEEAGQVSGSFQTSAGETPLNLNFDHYNAGNVNRLAADLRALVADNKATILSTPSVLTTNNSQARIRVIREVPILNQVVTGFQRTTEINVDYKDVGVMLNIKPRISREGKMVTMQIRTEVSEAPPEDYLTVPVEIGSGDAAEIVSRPVAPRVSRRKVETVARVDNNTPFIIGGLIRKDTSTITDGLPLLRNLPLLGSFFEVNETKTERREDIIVLTPRVIQPYGPKRPAQPKDSSRFDFLNNELFRSSYRIKAEDVFDLGFIREKEAITSTLEKARNFVTAHPERAEKPPFDEVQKERLPGEQAVVVRMIYEIVQKMDLHERINLGNLIYFQKAEGEPAGYDVEFLKGRLQEAGVMDGNHFPAEYPRKVLVLRYNLRPGSKMKQITGTPVATAEVKKVSSEDEMHELWRKGNQLEDYHREHSTLVIGKKDHLVRLKTAILVREILNVNPGLLSVENFNVGRRITIPQFEEKNDRIFLVDHNVSLYNFESEFYYAAFKDKLKKYVDGIRKVLRRYGR